MLGKVIKYEFKDTYRVNVMLMLLVALMTLVAAVGLAIPLGNMAKGARGMRWVEDSFATAMLMLTMVASLLLYVFTLVGVIYGLTIYMGVHFYKSMYSQEGYLTQTLPVTPHQLLIGKTITAGVWYLAMEALIGVSLLILVFVVAGVGGANLGLHITDIAEAFDEADRMFGRDGTAMGSLLLTILMVILMPFANMVVLFGAVTIGQLSQKHKVLMSLAAYFGIELIGMVAGYIIQIVSTVTTLKTMSYGSGAPSIMGNYGVTLLLALAECGILYFVSYYILSKKLNLE